MNLKLKVLIFVVAYNAEQTITKVIERIPENLKDNYDTHLLIIDDASNDNTFETAKNFTKHGFWCNTLVLKNPVNLGYGGNQKLGYRYAIDNSFDIVALIHGDGQYAPEHLGELLESFKGSNDTGAVFGSRMINKGDALKGGMPIYKYIGNQILTFIQNKLLSSKLTEFHTGYRLYRVNDLKDIPFELNTNDFHFDTEIIVQLLFSGKKIAEIPIPTFYGDEICHVNGLAYAFAVIRASLKARLIKLGIFYDPKYDLNDSSLKNHEDKLNFISTHSIAYSMVPPNSTLLDLGYTDGCYLEKLAAEKHCTITCADLAENRVVAGCRYVQCDLNTDIPQITWNSLDILFMLDIIEHLKNPEQFLEKLRQALSSNRKVKIVVTSGNVCFFITRLMMFLGQFNYGRRGILDLTHHRLFTVTSLGRLLRYAGYEILDKRFVPAPYPLAIGNNIISSILLKFNNVLAKILPGLFAYQTLYVIRPLPSSRWLLASSSR